MSGEAGFGGAGEGEAGIDPSPDLSTPRAIVPPQALFLDPAVMDFQLDDEGHYVGVHPVDHQVEMRLAMGFGSSPSAPGVGSTLRSLKIGSREQMTHDAREIVNTALADLLTRGDVVIVDVVAYAPIAWRAHVEVTYQNTRAPDADRNRTAMVG